MKIKFQTIFISLFILGVPSCRNYSSQIDKSPSGKYSFFTSVNRTDRSKKDYASVIIHLLDNSGKQILMFDTRAGDFSSWAVGWDHERDTLVLFSGDIGNFAYKIDHESLIGIELSENLNTRALELKVTTR